MAKIPLYDQTRLASSVVGTPGVDNSGQQFFQGVQKDAETIGNQVYANAEQDFATKQADLRRQQTLRDEATKALQEATDNGTVAETLAKAKENMAAQTSIIKQQYRNDPKLAVATANDVYDKENLDRIQELENRKESPLVIQKAKNALYTHTGAEKSAISTWENDQHARLLEEKASQVSFSFVSSMSKVDNTPNMLRGMISYFKGEPQLPREDANGNIVPALEPSENNKLFWDTFGYKDNEMKDKAVGEGIAGWLQQQATANPNQFEDILKENADLVALVPGKMQGPIIQEQRRVAADQKAANALQLHKDQNTATMDAYEKWTEMRARNAPAGELFDFRQKLKMAGKVPYSVIDSMGNSAVAELRYQERVQTAQTKEDLHAAEKAHKAEVDAAKKKAYDTSVKAQTQYVELHAMSGRIEQNTPNKMGELKFWNSLSETRNALIEAQEQWHQAYGELNSHIAEKLKFAEMAMRNVQDANVATKEWQAAVHFREQSHPNTPFDLDPVKNKRYTVHYWDALTKYYIDDKAAGHDPNAPGRPEQLRAAARKWVQSLRAGGQ